MYTLHNFEVFALREWAQFLPPYPHGEDATKHTPCMFLFSTYRACKLAHCAYSHEQKEIDALRAIRDSVLKEARDRKQFPLDVAKERREREQKERERNRGRGSHGKKRGRESERAASSAGPHYLDPETFVAEAPTSMVDVASSAAGSASYSNGHPAATGASLSSPYTPLAYPTELVPAPALRPPPSLNEPAMQQLLTDCVIAPPASSVIAHFTPGMPAPLFNLPSFERLHQKLAQSEFDRYFSVARRRRIQWIGCVTTHRRGQSETTS